MALMRNVRSANTPQFVPNTIEEVFALYLSRELNDLVRVRFYVRLTARNSMCVLLNALRIARRRKDQEAITPEEFLEVLDSAVKEDPFA
jgi:hypothetical protein